MVRKAIAPVYLFLCLLLGGSAQGVWGNALLQILAVLIIAWAFVFPRGGSLPRPVRALAVLSVVGLLFALVQLLPLPPGVWTSLPGRSIVVEGRQLLGLAPGWSAISLAPNDTMATLLTLLPPVALFMAIYRTGATNETWLAISLLVVTFAGVLLGLLQVSSGNPMASPWYLYRFSNFGFATGFFANSNHMASLLLVALPFLVALGAIAARSTKDVRKRYSVLALTGGGVGIAVIGIALNGSLAGLGLLLPVLIFSLLMVISLSPKLKLLAVGAGAVALAGFLALALSPVGERLALAQASTSLSTRQDMLSTSFEAIREFGPVGSGLGTFAKVYPLFEDPDSIGLTYVNHAHNDYVELVIEMGITGLVLIILFLGWWAISARKMLAAPNASLFARAGAIGSGAVLLHSAVDYPLRTAAIASVFAMCLAMMLLSRTSARSSKDLREARHLVIE